MKMIGVIPARLGSTRLAEKVLKPIDGKPMIQRVWERANGAQKLDALIVACDDARIVECVNAFGGRAELTRADHPNGSSRVSEIASRENADVFINIQGDEPMINPRAIDQLAGAFSDTAVKVATLAVRKHDLEDYANPNVVKVVCDGAGDALYFSRSPLPYYREKPEQLSFLKHLGIYGYRRDFLLQFVGWETGKLEDCEKLEQLRILERGFRIRVLETPHDSWSVDTAEDLAVVESKIKNLA
jgi:3-deoxy-manno-octulosonate cytidylyltransferase (CMP-KDO synthetase)